ncbi:uncharacterized protein LOC141849024 [Brevipalpus obovatus]|uniref:uncharacterized protein LOC141849024 n=1 Tax=Brevipalpus obovatus TaxID=246614 RepID=UPI003D9EDCEC
MNQPSGGDNILFQNEIIANNPFLWISPKPSRLRSLSSFIFIFLNSLFACSILIMTSRYLSARLGLPRFPTSTAFLILITSIFVSVNIFFLHRFDFLKISQLLDENWAKIAVSIDPAVMSLIGKYQKRQIVLCNFFLIATIFLWLPFVIRGLMYNQNLIARTVWIFSFLIVCCAAWSRASIMYMLFTCCTFIKAAFYGVADRVKELHGDEKKFSLINLEACRFLHSIGIDMVRSCNGVWKYYIPIFTLYQAASIILLLYGTSYQLKFDFIRLTASFCLLESILALSVVFFFVIEINLEANKAYHDIYKLSIGDRNDDMKYEVILFLDRLKYKDVGFSFMNTSVITPRIIWTLLTAISTCIIALPSFYEEG